MFSRSSSCVSSRTVGRGLCDEDDWQGILVGLECHAHEKQQRGPSVWRRSRAAHALMWHALETECASGSGTRWGPHGNPGPHEQKAEIVLRPLGSRRKWGPPLVSYAQGEENNRGRTQLLFTWWGPWSHHMAWFLVHECKEIKAHTPSLLSTTTQERWSICGVHSGPT